MCAGLYEHPVYLNIPTFTTACGRKIVLGSKTWTTLKGSSDNTFLQ